MRIHALAISTTCIAAVLVLAAPRRGSSNEQSPPSGADAEPLVLRYVGVEACASCHKGKFTGDQIASWKASPHAQAYRTLEGEAAAAIAKKLGIDQDPTKSALCLSCHTTGAGALKSRFEEGFNPELGVQCEACHGPGSEYSKGQHMFKHEKAVAMGLQVGDAATCKRCHNSDSPTFKGFDYTTAMKQISHPLAPR